MYEYLLRFWGSGEKEVFKMLQSDQDSYWFSCAKNRDDFKKNIEDYLRQINEVLVFAEEEGFDVRKKTVAYMDLVLPNGEIIKHVDDFNCGYPVDSAYYMYTDGNYSCDCNLSLFIKRYGVEIDELECGETIKIKNLRVVLE